VRLDRVDQLGPGNERHAKAGERQHHPGIARILIHIMQAALDRADGDGVRDEQRLVAGLDREQAGEAKAHGHGKANAVPIAAFRHFLVNRFG
jgi:hypothetical protein